MGTRAMVLFVAIFSAASAFAAPGERGGAYGGDTTGKAGDVRFKNADGNGDGVVSEQEARLVGIEKFKAVDRNHDGVLDRAEFAAMESAGDGAGGSHDAAQPDPAQPDPKNARPQQ